MTIGVNRPAKNTRRVLLQLRRQIKARSVKMISPPRKTVEPTKVSAFIRDSQPVGTKRWIVSRMLRSKR